MLAPNIFFCLFYVLYIRDARGILLGLLTCAPLENLLLSASRRRRRLGAWVGVGTKKLVLVR